MSEKHRQQSNTEQYFIKHRYGTRARANNKHWHGGKGPKNTRFQDLKHQQDLLKPFTGEPLRHGGPLRHYGPLRDPIKHPVAAQIMNF